MSTSSTGNGGQIDSITDNATDLIDATADAAEEKVIQARNRLKAALASAKDTYVYVQKKAVENAKVADKAIRENPYYAIGVAFGVGALVGYLLRRRD